jgi:aldose 1-epimerase
MKNLFIGLATATIIVASCNAPKQETSNGFEAVDTLVKQASFQKEIDGKKVDLYTLKNDSGMVVKVTNYGARIVSILIPDKNGIYGDIALGCTSIDGYLADNMYLGCVVGRYANRIGKATFKLDGKEYKLSKNDKENTLHGGLKGLDKVVWDVVQKGDTLDFTYVSPDMEEGYPGTLTIKMKYILNNNNEIVMEYEATTDKTTVINLSNHTYYNLHGEGIGSILDQQLEIFANQTTPVDKGLIPSGQLADVAGTPFDFNTPTAIGARIDTENEQLKNGGGYDHNWILNKKAGELTLGLRLTDTISGRVLEIFTTEPAMQMYSGNFMNATKTGKNGKLYNYRSAIVMEPQHYPDSPNHDNFPSTVLKPGETYKQTSIVKFSVKK